MNKKKALTDQSFWENTQEDVIFEKVHEKDLFRLWINKYIPYNKQGKAIEIGCYPGRYLTILGDLGYELNGLDFYPNTDKLLPSWLNQLGYKTGQFINDDFLKYDFKQQEYDVVLSLGFIEHFVNYDEIINKHLSLVRTGGFIILETPNYRGWIQRALQIFINPDNYEKHFIKSMNPDKWEMLMKDKFQVLYKGYFPVFFFWMDKESRNPLQNIMGKFIIKLIPWINRFIPWKSQLYSPFCGLIAKKVSD